MKVTARNVRTKTEFIFDLIPIDDQFQFREAKKLYQSRKQRVFDRKFDTWWDALKFLHNIPDIDIECDNFIPPMTPFEEEALLSRLSVK